MPSSISSSDTELARRVVPEQQWGLISLLVLCLECACVAGWEIFWRHHYFVPGDYEDTPAVWQMQRERATGNATVLIGSSRMWEDVDLTAWQQTAGARPIQLAMAGRNPQPVLDELAADSSFRGVVVCEVTPYLFYVEPEAYTTDFIHRGHTQTLSQRAANRLGMLLESRLAFIDNETRLSTLWKRLEWPLRAGNFPVRDVPKGHEMRADRDTRMWTRVEADPGYQALFRRLWLFYAGGPQPSLEEKPASAATAYPGIDAIVAHASVRVATDIAKLRSRGGDVVFVRFPAAGPAYWSEARSFPRSLTWEPLLRKTCAAGVHFADFEQLQGFNLPEWSHMSAADAPRFTRALAPLVMRAVALDHR
ncbi:MAG TPA: hypothetical protein VNO35_18145 [Steroidobacteraceae bacterium]|nr:hypothetical protein [Steroidobacteraceae bacterium]